MIEDIILFTVLSVVMAGLAYYVVGLAIIWTMLARGWCDFSVHYLTPADAFRWPVIAWRRRL